MEISVDGINIISDSTGRLRDVWEETSHQLEKLQANPKCVEEEGKGLAERKAPPFKITFDVNKNERLSQLTNTAGLFTISLLDFPQMCSFSFVYRATL